MSQPDLFVVCKNCGSEVSPYVTECPYCGQRVRKRAPKLDRSGEDSEPRAKQRLRSRLPRLGVDEVKGIAPDGRPVATIVLITISLAVTLVLASGRFIFPDVGGLVLPDEDQPWRLLTTTFVHDSLGYQFVGLTAVGVFGSLLERRFRWPAVLLVFLAAGTAGAAAAWAVDLPPLFESGDVYLVQGVNGAALGLLTAWLIDDRRAAARGDDRGNDLIGVYVFAVLLALLPLAVTEASVVTGLVGAVVGALLGLIMNAVARR